jgi:methyl coenzyme M reductase subunit D
MTHITKVIANGKPKRKRITTYDKMVELQVQLGQTRQEAQNQIRKVMEKIAYQSHLKFEYA